MEANADKCESLLRFSGVRLLAGYLSCLWIVDFGLTALFGLYTPKTTWERMQLSFLVAVGYFPICLIFLRKVRSSFGKTDILSSMQILPTNKRSENEIYVPCRRAQGFIFSIDIRGYTDLAATCENDGIDRFTSTYLAMVKEKISEYGGYVHKTSGDGHLISFGIMEDGPQLEFQDQISNCVRAFDDIVANLRGIAEETLSQGNVSLGAAIDFGDVDIRTVHHTSSEMEFDIFGPVIIRSTRLEAHTKVIRENFAGSSSLLIISPSAAQFLQDHESFIKYQTLFKPVRDFKDISWFLVKPYTLSEENVSSVSILKSLFTPAEE
ncbi:MAG: adenylate/guanylate cyclase domain-containing protein [Oligoflexales bacterium]